MMQIKGVDVFMRGGLAGSSRLRERSKYGSSWVSSTCYICASISTVFWLAGVPSCIDRACFAGWLLHYPPLVK